MGKVGIIVPSKIPLSGIYNISQLFYAEVDIYAQKKLSGWAFLFIVMRLHIGSDPVSAGFFCGIKRFIGTGDKKF